MGIFQQFWIALNWPDSAGEIQVLTIAVLLLLAVWSLYWKAHALWRAAKKNQKSWFVALILINTLGILEILYLYFISKKSVT